MSYHKDSRNENVELDYNNLKINSPTTFTKTVDFSQTSSPTTGYTWPRAALISFASVLYTPAGSAVDPWVAASSGTNEAYSDGFSTIQPILDVDDYVTCSSLTGITTILQAGYYYINAVFFSTLPLEHPGDMICGIWFKNVAGDAWNSIATGATSNSQGHTSADFHTVSCGNIRYFPAGATLKTTFASTTSSVVHLDLNIVKLR